MVRFKDLCSRVTVWCYRFCRSGFDREPAIIRVLCTLDCVYSSSHSERHSISSWLTDWRSEVVAEIFVGSDDEGRWWCATAQICC